MADVLCDNWHRERYIDMGDDSGSFRYRRRHGVGRTLFNVYGLLQMLCINDLSGGRIHTLFPILILPCHDTATRGRTNIGRTFCSVLRNFTDNLYSAADAALRLRGNSHALFIDV